jgi:hypothetical protein
VKKAFQGRVTLPGYQDNRFNASMALSALRSSDSGMFRCEVVVGINDEQDTVPLEVTGSSDPCYTYYTQVLFIRHQMEENICNQGGTTWTCQIRNGNFPFP